MPKKNKPATTVYPLSAVRALALHTQGLDAPPKSDGTLATQADLYTAVQKTGSLQIDTLQMAHRSHYLAAYSRVGRYDLAELDKVSWGDGQPNHPTRKLFEYWLHAACLVPLEDYRYLMPKMRWFRDGNHHWWKTWVTDPTNRAMTDQVLERVRKEGPVRTSDFDYDGPRRDSWWDWKPAKRALEYLYDRGDLMIAGRVKFQRVYDVPERVLPDWVDRREPTHAEMQRYFLERALKSLGVAQLMQVADYAYQKRNEARPHLEAMQKEGVAVEIKAELSDGETHSLVVHQDSLDLLEKAASGEIQARRTTFLTPFDSLFWAKDRDEQFWNFEQILETYKPEPIRKWGYYCLPILWHDQLIGRFDVKMERKVKNLRLKTLHLEPGIHLTDEMVTDVAAALRDFMAFHDAQTVMIEKSNPPDFAQRVSAIL